MINMEGEKPPQEEGPQEGEEEFRRVVSELRQTQQNIEALQERIEMIKTSIEEIEKTKETLEGLDDVESDTEIMVPIGSGVFVPAEIKNPENVLSEIGADLVAERAPEEVIKMLDKRKSDLKDSREEAEEKVEELEDKVEELRPKAQQLMSEREGGAQMPR